MASMPSASPETDSSFEIAPAAAEFTARSRDAHLPCYLSEPYTRNRDFYPRAIALQRLDEALLPSPRIADEDGTKKLKTFILYNLRGMGKTEIALEFAFSRQGHFDAIFFLHADQGNKLAEEFGQISVKLGLETAKGSKDPTESRERVKSWLANPIKRSLGSEFFNGAQRSLGSQNSVQSGKLLANWLVVFENADHPQLLAGYWPSDGYGSVLVTTRDPMSMTQFFFGDVGLKLVSLSTTEGAAYLQYLTQSKDEPGAKATSEAIADQLDGVPLAIAQMAAIICKQSLSLKDFYELYQEVPNREDFYQQRIGPQRGYEHNLASVWALDRLKPGALTLLNVLSFMNPDCIQEIILTENLKEVEAPNYPHSKGEYHQVLNELLQSSIVYRKASTGELRVHRLVQDVAQSKMAPSSHVLQSNFDLTVSLLSLVFPFITGGDAGRAHNVGRWEQCATLYPHISHLLRICEGLMGIGLWFEPTVKLAHLLMEAGWYQYERANINEANLALDMAQPICESSVEDMKHLLAPIHGTRACLAMVNGDADNCYFHATVRLDLEEQLRAETGKDTAQLAGAYNDLAHALSMRKLYDEAIPFLQRSMAVREGLEGFKASWNYAPLYELGLIALLQGFPMRRPDTYTKRFMIASKSLARKTKDPPVSTGNLLYALGNVYATLGQLEESFAYHQRALIQYRSAVGDTHLVTANACYKVANHNVRFGDYRSAKTLLDQALEIYKDRHYVQPQIARCQFRLSEVLYALGKRAESEDMLSKARDISLKLVLLGNRSVRDVRVAELDDLVPYDAR